MPPLPLPHSFSGHLWVDRCLARWLWYYSWRLDHKRQTKAAKIAYAKMGTAKIFRLYRDAALRQKALKAKLSIATGGVGKKLMALTFSAWMTASREKKRVSFAVKALVRKIWRELLLVCTRAWKEAAAEQAYERKKSNRVETLQEQAKRCNHTALASASHSHTHCHRRMDEMTLHAVFFDWLDSFMQRREELEEAAGRIFGNSRKLVLRNALASMRAYACERAEAKAKILTATKWLYRSVLVKTMQSWRSDARETADQKRRVEEKRRRAMYRFANRCVGMTFARWAVGTRRRKHVASLAAAAHRTMSLAMKKGAFARLRENVAEQAQQRVSAVTGAIAWSVATPGKISMWPTLLRQAQHQAASVVPVHDLTQDAAGSLAAFGKDNFNNALLQGLTMGARMATSAADQARRHRHRHHELSPLSHNRRSSRLMELRPDSGDDEEGAQGQGASSDDGEDFNVRSAAGSMLPLPLLSHAAPPSLQPKRPMHRAPAAAVAHVRSGGQHLGSLSAKQRQVEAPPLISAYFPNRVLRNVVF